VRIAEFLRRAIAIVDERAFDKRRLLKVCPGIAARQTPSQLHARTISVRRYWVYQRPLIRRIVWRLLNRIFVWLRIRLRVFVRFGGFW
jgi:hypothetical protein